MNIPEKIFIFPLILKAKTRKECSMFKRLSAALTLCAILLIFVTLPTNTDRPGKSKEEPMCPVGAGFSGDDARSGKTDAPDGTDASGKAKSSENVGKDYIRWIEFTPTAEILGAALDADISTHETEHPVGWITLLALVAAGSGGNFSKVSVSDIRRLAEELSAGKAPEELTKNQRLYRYYLEAYGAILGGMVGEYAVTTQKGGTPTGDTRYGLRVFSPIAKGYSYNDYDDFGASRSYGYKRRHLGHDIMGNVGTPIIATESGYVEHLGWNQYGGWRVGIRSFDGKRYYYYAHLRRGHPYCDLYEGKYVNAGEVIGYLGMTGYSAKEDVNNIDVPHLHFGLEIIFDKSQTDGWNQIWIDLYEMTGFLSRNRAQVHKDAGDSFSDTVYLYPETPD